jgi:Mor family transcriptional regulator
MFGIIYKNFLEKGVCMYQKPLSEVLDKKNYKKLVEEFGGKRIWIPKYGNSGSRDKEFFEIRNKSVISLRKQGISIADLSKKFKLSQKSIYNITQGYKPLRGSMSN